MDSRLLGEENCELYCPGGVRAELDELSGGAGGGRDGW